MKMKLKDAAAALGLSEHYLRTEAKAGRIPHLKSGKKYYFDVEQVDAYLKELSMKSVRSKDEPERHPEYGKLRRVT